MPSSLYSRLRFFTVLAALTGSLSCSNASSTKSPQPAPSSDDAARAERAKSPPTCTFQPAPGAEAEVDTQTLPHISGIFSPPETEDGLACDQAACLRGLQLDLVEVPEQAPGDYQIAVTTEKGTLRCDYALPMHSCDPAATELVGGTEGGDEGVLIDCDAPEVPSLMIYDESNPKSVRIELSQGGVALGSGVVTPRYSNIRQDGSKCPGDCWSGEETVRIE